MLEKDVHENDLFYGINLKEKDINNSPVTIYDYVTPTFEVMAGVFCFTAGNLDIFFKLSVEA